MSDASFRRDNHYTPRVYLRGFAGSGKRIFAYRILVSHSEVPLWKPSSTDGVGYLSHLYTRTVAGQETDEIEEWLNREFENPAAAPLEKATSGAKLTPEDWTHLINFLAAQSVRTPAYFFQNFPVWQAHAPDLLNSALQDVQKIAEAKKSGQPITLPEDPHSEYLPIRVTAHHEPGDKTAQLRASTFVGRGYWLHAMRWLLTGDVVKILHDQRWSILAPHEGLSWFTSDDPVIRLRYDSEGKYNFQGGIKTGTEILLPLSPHHLMYTRIGERPPQRGEILPRDKTEVIRRLIAEHAYRMIFSASQDACMPTLRPRTVNNERFRQEQEQWRNWHIEQTEAERRLRDGRDDATEI